MLNLEQKLKYALKSKNKNQINDVFEEIYYEYGHLVGFVISKYVSSKLDIEELINDVFLSFFNNLDKIKMKNIKAYLSTSAKNKAIDYLRKNKNAYILENDLLMNMGSNDNTLYSLILNDMKKILTTEEIEIILEHIVYNQSFKTIALKFNKPTSTISTKYYQAIEKYRMEAKYEIR